MQTTLNFKHYGYAKNDFFKAGLRPVGAFGFSLS